MIDEQGITHVPEKVTAIQNFPQPASLRQLRRFLGLVNYYRRFIPGCSRISTPLTNMLQQQQNKNAKIQIEGEALTAFYNAKKALADFTKLYYICNDDTATLSLTTDASGDSIGAVLQQTQNGLEKTISFFSVKLNTAQHLLKRVTGNLLVDKALSSLTQRTRFHRFHWPQTTHLRLTCKYREIYAQRYSTTGLYIAIYLGYPIHKRLRQYCRRYTLTLHNTVYWFGKSHLRAHCRWTTKRCHIRQIKWYFSTAERTSCSIRNENNTLRCQNKSIKTLYTTIIKKRLFTHFHNLSHPGHRATTKLISDRFVWPNIHTDIKKTGLKPAWIVRRAKKKKKTDTKSPPGQLKKTRW